MGVKVRIAVCGSVPGNHIHEDAGELVRACARQAGFDDADLVRCKSPIDMIESVLHPKGADLPDLLVCGIGMRGLSALDVARDLNNAGAMYGKDEAPGAVGEGAGSAAAPMAANWQNEQPMPFVPPIMAFSENAGDAYEAQYLGIADFIAGAIDAPKLSRVFTRRLESVFIARRQHLDVFNGSAMFRIPLSRIVRIETVGHDQVVTEVGGSTFRMRKTSGDMYDSLSHDERFYKVGSSNIVNLDWVSCTREGNKSIHMGDGSIVTVPVRLRTTFEDVLLSRPL